jgi:hypothetical protein
MRWTTALRFLTFRRWITKTKTKSSAWEGERFDPC